MSELARIAAALEELAAIERERLEEERRTRAAKRAPRTKLEPVKPGPEAQATAARVLRRLGVR